MRTTERHGADDGYALARAPEEYERLRAQARVWETATTRVLDQIGLSAGSALPGRGLRPGRDDAADGRARRSVGIGIGDRRR